jgi:hypothetical protein
MAWRSLCKTQFKKLKKMSNSIVEIRDYTIEADWFESYKKWAEELAGPWLKENLDVIDFWIDDGIKAEVEGSSPVVSPNGQPNVCWIIRWPNKETRDKEFEAFLKNSEWQEIWSKHPNENSYLQMNVRFMKSVSQ